MCQACGKALICHRACPPHFSEGSGTPNQNVWHTVHVETRERHRDLNSQRAWELNSARTLREGFVKMGLEGWIGVHGAGSWGRGRKAAYSSLYRFINDPSYSEQDGLETSK